MSITSGFKRFFQTAVTQTQSFVRNHTKDAESVVRRTFDNAPKLAQAPRRGNDLKDPAVMSRDSFDMSYKPVSGQLFVNGVSGDDAIQGRAGTCFFMAPLSSAAQADPALIERNLKQNADGSYTARFYEKQPDATFKEVLVTVDGDLPLRKNGQASYARGRDKNELWPALYEKAYAQWKGGYEVVGQGGNPGQAMEELTGKSVRSLRTAEAGPDAVFSELTRATAGGKLAVTATPGLGWGTFLTQGVVGNHAYTVTGTSESNGTKYVHLRNPFGRTEPGQWAWGDGSFKLPLDKYLKVFDQTWTAN